MIFMVLYGVLSSLMSVMVCGWLVFDYGSVNIMKGRMGDGFLFLMISGSMVLFNDLNILNDV